MTAKEAAESAAKYLTDLIPIQGKPLVEEVSKDGFNWLITLSYTPATGSGIMLGFGREYKVFDIDANGQVVSMKIRSVKE